MIIIHIKKFSSLGGLFIIEINNGGYMENNRKALLIECLKEAREIRAIMEFVIDRLNK